MTTSIRTLDEGQMTLSGQELDESLRSVLRGRVVTRDDDQYEAMREVENRHIDKKPGLILRCSGVADVIDAVRFARANDLLVAVRSGGHHVAGHGSTDGGMVIDLRDLNAVWVDPRHQLVHVQGGATWGDVDREAQAFGLAVPGGIVSTTGVAGLTLGGGIGWLHRKGGLTCDRLRSVDMITAEGDLVRASKDENPDLFWGLCGGGGNFGIAVGFTFEAMPLGPTVMVGDVFHRASDGPEVLRKWRDFAANAPEEITTRAIFWTMPTVPALPPEVQGQEVLLTAALYAGPPDQGAKALRGLREIGRPLADISSPMPFRAYQSMFDPLLAGLRSYWKSTFLDQLTDEAIDLIARRVMNRPDPKTLIHVPQLGGEMSRRGPAETAFGDRSPQWMLSVDGNWEDPAKADEVIAWVRAFVDEANALRGARGTYLNFNAEGPADKSAVRGQYGENLMRLRHVKKKYDPSNRFRINNNIVPD